MLPMLPLIASEKLAASAATVRAFAPVRPSGDDCFEPPQAAATSTTSGSRATRRTAPLETNSHRIAGLWPPLRSEHVDECRRCRRPLRARVGGDVANQARLQPHASSLDSRQNDVVRNERRAEPGGSQPRCALGLRGAHRAAWSEPCAAAGLLENPREPVILVVENP